jgi:hypothetical protein
MYLLVFGAAVPGVVLLFLTPKSSRFRLVGGVSSLFLAAYMYGFNESLNFIESLGVLGFAFWLGLLLALAMSLIAEFSTKGASRKALAIASLLVSSASNAVFAFWFAQAVGLGIV